MTGGELEGRAENWNDGRRTGMTGWVARLPARKIKVTIQRKNA